jgi:cysteine-rich repeat protein
MRAASFAAAAAAVVAACGSRTSLDADVGPDVPRLCGNGVLDAGEECDDGNTRDDDACRATC